MRNMHGQTTLKLKFNFGRRDSWVILLIIKRNKHKRYEKCEVRQRILASETLQFITALDGPDTIMNILFLLALIWMAYGNC